MENHRCIECGGLADHHIYSDYCKSCGTQRDFDDDDWYDDDFED